MILSSQAAATVSYYYYLQDLCIAFRNLKLKKHIKLWALKSKEKFDKTLKLVSIVLMH